MPTYEEILKQRLRPELPQDEAIAPPQDFQPMVEPAPIQDPIAPVAPVIQSQEDQLREKLASARLMEGILGASEQFKEGATGVKAQKFDLGKDLKDRLTQLKKSDKASSKLQQTQRFIRKGKKIDGIDVGGSSIIFDPAKGEHFIIAPQGQKIYQTENPDLFIDPQSAERVHGTEFSKKRRREERKADLVKQATSGELGKAYNQARTSADIADSMREFNKNPGPFKDYGILMSGLKVLQHDDSVVREAEIKMGQDATDLENKFRNYIQKVMDGKSLQPEQRQEMYDTISYIASRKASQYKKVVKPIYNLGKEWGLEENDIVNTSIFNHTEPDLTKYHPNNQKKSKIAVDEKNSRLDRTRAILGNPAITPETRQKVLKAAKKEFPNEKFE